MIKAIDTLYNGNYFRSRLEARWAVFFDAIGVRWQYEAEGYDLGDGIKYLPDFWFPDYDCYGEVKPDGNLSRPEVLKMELLAKGTGKMVLLLEGPPSDSTLRFMDWDKGDPEFCPDGFWFNHIDDEMRMIPFTGGKTKHLMTERKTYRTGSDFQRAIHAAQTKRFEHGAR